MKKSFPALLLPVLLFIAAPAVAQKKNRIFDDFKIMNAPRSNVPMGAIWTDIGPVGDGVSDDKLSVGESFQDFTSTTDQNLKASITGNIQNYLEGTVKAELWSSTEISLESVKIVRVSSTDVLRNNIGNTILYEAIRADQVSFIIDKKKSAELKATLPQTFAGADIISDTEVGSKRHIVAKGVGLYVAYRVVKLERSKSKAHAVKFKSQSSSGSSTVVFSNSFYLKDDNITVTLCPCDVIACANNKLAPYKNQPAVIRDNTKNWLNQCNAANYWTIRVTDRNELVNGKPRETVTLDKLNFDIWNKTYSLSNALTSSGIEIKYLDIEHLYLETLTMQDGYIVMLGASPKVRIVTESISFRNITSSGSNGW